MLLSGQGFTLGNHRQHLRLQSFGVPAEAKQGSLDVLDIKRWRLQIFVYPFEKEGAGVLADDKPPHRRSYCSGE